MADTHVLVTADVFRESHLQAIAAAVEGWATCERIAQGSSPSVYSEKLSRADIVVGWPKAELLASSNVRFFQLLSAGYDAYVSKGLEGKPGFVLCNARGALSPAAAEHCIALMMALVRRLPRHISDMSGRRWALTTYDEVGGTTACVIGLGSIGTEVALRCKAMNMQVIGVRRHPERGHAVAARVFGPEALKEAVATAEHVFLTVPGEADTRKLLDARILASFKRGAYLYNVARGSVIDENALVECLRSGHVQGAGLDVFTEEPLLPDSPLWNLPNVIVTPHTAGRSVREADRLCDLFVANLGRFRRKESLLNVVAHFCATQPNHAGGPS